MGMRALPPDRDDGWLPLRAFGRSALAVGGSSRILQSLGRCQRPFEGFPRQRLSTIARGSLIVTADGPMLGQGHGVMSRYPPLDGAARISSMTLRCQTRPSWAAN